jgi:hypothetical protein
MAVLRSELREAGIKTGSPTEIMRVPPVFKNGKRIAYGCRVRLVDLPAAQLPAFRNGLADIVEAEQARKRGAE